MRLSFQERIRELKTESRTKRSSDLSESEASHYPDSEAYRDRVNSPLLAAG